MGPPCLTAQNATSDKSGSTAARTFNRIGQKAVWVEQSGLGRRPEGDTPQPRLDYFDAVRRQQQTPKQRRGWVLTQPAPGQFGGVNL
jgi:hypothetical protein